MAKAKTTKPAATSSAPANEKTPAGLQRHPLSEKFSLPTTEEDRLALGTHMAKSEQIQDIIMFEGMILDGWERYMACRQQGLTPRFREYKGADPAMIAFGANTIRRRLNSVQKAVHGAKFLIYAQADGKSVTQKEVAKLACVSLQRLNEVVQLLRAADTNSEAAKAVTTLNTNPDVTKAALDQMLVDAGIVNPQARRDTAAKPTRTDTGDDGDDADTDADTSVDLLGGADIDALLDDDLDGDDDTPAARSAVSGKAADNDGPRIGVNKRPRETPASACARNFKGLTEPERLDFVRFAWGTLRPALEACIDQKRIEWPRLDAHADASAAAMADVTNALAKASGKAAPVSKGRGAAKGKATTARSRAKTTA